MSQIFVLHGALERTIRRACDGAVNVELKMA